VRRKAFTASEAARELGISLDTLRRWDRDGKIRVGRDAANRRVISAGEVARLRGGEPQRLSARNRFHGVVRSVKVDGLLAQVELVADEPAHVVAIVTAESVEQLGLKPGQTATAVIKSTSVMVER
jgi:molybdopterin-binding protein